DDATYRLIDVPAGKVFIHVVAGGDDVRIDALALHRVGVAHDGRFDHVAVHVDGVFQFSGADAVAGYVEHVIHASGDAVIARCVAQAAVAREVHVFVGREIGLAAALVVAIGSADHAGPREFDAQVAAHVVALQFLAVLVDQCRLDAGERQHGKAWNGGGDPRDGRDEDTSVLGLPPGVYNRCLPLADFFVIPIPRLLIDGLTHAAQLTDAAEVFSLDVFIACSHQRADGGGGRIEDVYLVFLHDIPEAAGVGPGRYAFEHQRGGTLRQRAVDDVRVAGDPADVGSTEIHFIGLVLEHVGKCIARVHHVSPAGVYHALGLARRTGGVEDEQHVFGIHLFGGADGVALGFHFGDFVFPPYIASLDHGNRRAGAGEHDDTAYRRALHQCVVYNVFQFDGFGAAEATV